MNEGAGTCSPNPCPTTTSTTTSTTETTTTTTTTSTTTTTIQPVGGAFLEFTTRTPGGPCGNTLDGSNALIKILTCGGLNIGGGLSIVPESQMQDGATSRFALSCAVGGGACDASCAGGICDIGQTSTAPAFNSADPDCTDTGCNFGTPLPIQNPALPTLSMCALNTWSAPASGTLDLTDGTMSMNVALNSDVFITGNLTRPCPKCLPLGTPPFTGTCDRGPRQGKSCTSTSSTGYTRDCPTGGVGTPGMPCVGNGNRNCCLNKATCNCPCFAGGGTCCDGSHLGPMGVDLSPLTTDFPTASAPDGFFCSGQSNPGCFGSGACVTITENGAAAGPLTTDISAGAVLASVFCIPLTGNGALDADFDLPGPGAISLPGFFRAHN